MPRSSILAFVLAVACFASVASSQQPEGRDPARGKNSREQWRTMSVGGTQVGYVHNRVETVERDGKEVVVNTHTAVISIALPRERGAVVAPSDTRSKITIQSEETVDGDVLGFRYQVQNPPLVATRKVGRISDGRMQIETEAKGNITTTTEDFPADVKGPAFADRSLWKDPLEPNETRTITTFDPRSAKVDTVRFEARDYENVLLMDGTEKRLLHVVSTHSVAPQHVFHEFLDEAGDSWKTTIPSQNMVIHTTSKAIALKPFTDAETP